MDRNLIRIASLAAGLSLAAGCQSNRSQELAYVERPVEQLYLTATSSLDRGRYDEAIAYFQEVERQHPFSEWAARAQIMTAFANYQARRYDEAIAASQRYVNLHPGSEAAPYAYYLVAVSYFDRIMDVGRDQGMTELANAALQDVIRRYPDSDYARDASLKLDMVNDQLAGKEMEIGRWYLRRDQHLAALNRFRNVVVDYARTSHAPEALHRLVETYLALGLTEEARNTAAVLGYNHPDSDWYRESYRLLTGEGVAMDGDGDRGGILSRFF